MQKLRSEEEISSKWEKTYTKPIVSICCITYNHEKYLEQAIQGFLTQETNFPFEVIIHDDASTDKSVEIINKYKASYPKIIKTILQEKNQYSQNVNIFTEHILPLATGEFIALCEGDDFWTSPNKLSHQEKLIRENKNISISIHNAKILNEKNGTCREFNEKSPPKILGPKDVLSRPWFAPTASFFFRSNLITQCKKNSILERDIDLLFYLSLKGDIHYTQETYSAYRYLSSGSLSENSINKKSDLYRHKLRFLNKADQLSSYRYITWTTLARARTTLSFAYYIFKKTLKKY